ncbi:MAG: hypothetical protein U0992_18335 [Planctomycetaceae bacterium]
MLILSMRAGEVASIDNIAVNIGELTVDRARVTVNAPIGSRVKLMPEDVVVTPQISVWRATQEQIHIDEDIQIWVVRLNAKQARIGFFCDRKRHVTLERVITEELGDESLNE